MTVFTGGYWRVILDENGFATFARERHPESDPDGRYGGVPNRWVERGSWRWSQVDRMFFSRADGVWRLYAHPAAGVDPTLSALPFERRPSYWTTGGGWLVCHRGNFTGIRWRQVARAFHRHSAGEVTFDASALPVAARWLIGDGR
jgi:hypothetical protein